MIHNWTHPIHHAPMHPPPMHQLRTDHRRGLRRARAPMATAAAASRASPRAQRTALFLLCGRLRIGSALSLRSRWQRGGSGGGVGGGVERGRREERARASALHTRRHPTRELVVAGRAPSRGRRVRAFGAVPPRGVRDRERLRRGAPRPRLRRARPSARDGYR